MRTPIADRRLLRLILVSLAVASLGCPPARYSPNPVKALAGETDASPSSDPWADRTDLISSPAVKRASPLQLPAVTRHRLDNGLQLLVLPDHSLPLIDLLLLVKAGHIDDPPDKVGLASFTASMLRHGTRRWSADQLSRRVDEAGLSLDAGSGYEFSSVGCSGRSSSLLRCLELVSELTLHPSFPKKEMKQVLAKHQQSVRALLDDPESLAEQHFHNMLYGDDHPAGRPMTLRGLATIERSDLVQFFKRRFVPSNALLVVAGDIDPQQIFAAVKRKLGRWRGRSVPPRAVKPVTDPPAGLTVVLVDHPQLSQSFFSLGHAGIRVADPDRDAVRVMNYTLGGGGFSSRLMQSVRAKGGKTYGVSSSFDANTVDGHFAVSSFTRNEQLWETVELVRRELRRINTQPPTPAETQAAAGKIAGGYAIRFKTGTDLALALAEAQLRGLSDAYVTELAVRVGRLQPASIAAAARKHVRPDRLVLAIVGAASRVAPQLKRAGVKFERISYLDPISAAERRAARQARASASKPPSPTAKQLRVARRLIERALRVAGGSARLSAVKTLKLSGTASMGNMKAPYEALFSWPDRLRLSMKMEQIDIVMTVDSKGGQAVVSGGGVRKLPPQKVAQLRSEIWRQPPWVLAAALSSKQVLPLEAQLVPGQRAVQFWKDGRPTTLVLDRPGRLVELRYPDSQGREQRLMLSRHKRVGGLQIPHRVELERAGRRQTIDYKKVVIE